MQVASAIGVKKGINQRWASIDPSAYTVRELFTYYRQVQITISDLNQIYYLDLSTLSTQYYTYDNSINTLISTLSLADLTLKNTGIILNQQKATAYTSLDLDCSLQLCSLDGTVSNTPTVSDYLMLRNTTSQNFDFSSIYETCLISYNGLLHLPVLQENVGIYLKNGTLSAFKPNRHLRASILDFSNVGNITYEQFTESNISYPFDQCISFKINTTLTNKSLMLSFMGILLMIDDNSIRMVGPQEYLIDLKQLPMAGLIPKLGLSINLGNILNSITSSTSTFTQDQLTAMMLLPQTFAIIIDTPEIYSSHYYVQNIQMPNKYYSYQSPLHALVDELGRILPYYRSSFADRFVINPDLANNISYTTGNTGLISNMSPGNATINTVPNLKLVEYGKDY